MATTPPEERLIDALVEFTGCIGEALDDLCSYGLTIGETYVPFDPDPEDECDDEENPCTQMWVRVSGVTPFGTVEGGSFGGDSCSVDKRIELEIGILRCMVIEDDGEAPTASDVLVAAAQAMVDMQRMECSALSCTAFESVELGNWQPLGPLGGQVGGVWTMTVEL